MSKVGRWSTTAASNNAAPPDGWPEGQAPSTVNDCARENMAAIRTVFQDAQYFDQDFTPTYISATTFSVPGDQTSAIHAGRRLKIYDASSGATVIYATVVTASYTTVTTIQISADAGQLTSSLSSFALAIPSKNNSSIPHGLTLSGSAIATENLTVAGTTTASGAVTLLTTLSVSGSTVLKGALSVGGASTVAGTFTASGATTLKTTLNVEGTTSLSGAVALGTTLSVSGAAVVNGALSVGGATTLNGTLTVGDVAIVNKNIVIYRQNSTVNGAKLTLARASDNTADWLIDLLGAESGATASTLRIYDRANNDRLTIDSAGLVTISQALSVGGATKLAGTLSVSGTVAMTGNVEVGNLSVIGATVLRGTVSVSAAGGIVAVNTAKAWVRFNLSAGGVTTDSSFNVSSVSRSATGVARVTFTNALSDASFTYIITSIGFGSVTVPTDVSTGASTIKSSFRNVNNSVVDGIKVNIVVYR